MSKQMRRSKKISSMHMKLPKIDPSHNPSNPHPQNTPGVGFKLTPKSFYLYYIDMDDNLPRVRHFFYPGGDDTIDTTGLPDLTKKEFKSEVQNIVNDALSPAPLNTHLMTSRNFINVRWRKISYTCFVVDIPNWKFVTEDDPTNTHPMVMSDSNGAYKGNTCFFDGDLINFTDPRQAAQPPIPDTLRGFYAINHMTKNLNGDLLTDPRYPQNFGFNICFSVPYSKQLNGEEMICIFDPGGENIGPPIGPP